MSSVADRKRAVLERTTLTTSRLLDFASKKELTAQTGHDPDDWPLVVLKELVDNSIDACEEASIAPEVAVTVDKSGITVADNGLASLLRRSRARLTSRSEFPAACTARGL